MCVIDFFGNQAHLLKLVTTSSFSSGGLSNTSVGFSVYTDNITTIVDVNNGLCSWKTYYELGFGEDWTNIGLIWSIVDGIKLLIKYLMVD